MVRNTHERGDGRPKGRAAREESDEQEVRSNKMKIGPGGRPVEIEEEVEALKPQA